MRERPFTLCAGFEVEYFTFEECVAHAREAAAAGLYSLVDAEITHTDGRRWYWEMAGPNVTLKVDKPQQS